MASYETLKRKADELLKAGDAAGGCRTAEGRRLLRKCRRYRAKQRQAIEGIGDV